jgi:hypothetical protein
MIRSLLHAILWKHIDINFLGLGRYSIVEEAQWVAYSTRSVSDLSEIKHVQESLQSSQKLGFLIGKALSKRKSEVNERHWGYYEWVLNI